LKIRKQYGGETSFILFLFLQQKQFMNKKMIFKRGFSHPFLSRIKPRIFTEIGSTKNAVY